MLNSRFLCSRCRVIARKAAATLYTRSAAPYLKAALSTKSSPVSETLAQPTWSVRSLLAKDNDAAAAETITADQLHHLLRLSALPQPKSEEEERSMIATLQSQLHFVRAVQQVDTEGVEPLQAIRDETEDGLRESTIGLDDLHESLAKETRVGHYKRPRRPRTTKNVESEAEKWDALSTASKKAGRYFVVESGKQS